MYGRLVNSFIAICICNIAFSQSYTQMNLVDRFTSNRAVRIIAQLAHPLSSEQSYSVGHSGHTYYLSVNYKYNGNYFTCTHSFELNAAGEPQRYGVYQCGATGWWKCFEGLDFWKSVFTSLTEDEKDKIPQYLGKALSQLSVKEFCFGRLYYAWKDGGYYTAY